VSSRPDPEQAKRAEGAVETVISTGAKRSGEIPAFFCPGENVQPQPPNAGISPLRLRKSAKTSVEMTFAK
jgi:hypothetical protein